MTRPSKSYNYQYLAEQRSVDLQRLLRLPRLSGQAASQKVELLPRTQRFHLSDKVEQLKRICIHWERHMRERTEAF